MVSGESMKNVLDNYTDLLRVYQSQLTNLTTWQGTSRNQLDMKVTNFLEEYNNIIGNQIASYANACELYQTYIEAKRQLNTNIDNYNEAVRIKDNRSAQSFCNNINTLTPSVNNLKTQIESYLNSAASTKLSAPKLQANPQTTSVGLSNSNKTLIPEVQQFLEQNKGKTVEIPENIRKALGLQCEGLLSIPDDYDASKAYPFLLWLVGTGHAGGSVSNLKTANFAKSLVNGKYDNKDALIYIPCRWGNGDPNNSKYNASMLDNDLTNIVNGLNVDPNRISGAGSSVGAFAIAYLTTSHPNLFSSVAMTGGGYGGSLNNGINVDKAIQGSPNTTYIWYVANNDETSKEYVNGEYSGPGVHTYTLNQHQQLQNAGINSVYYELGGSLGHSYAVDRFATRALLYDLTHIIKGQQFNIQKGIYKVSAEDSAQASLDGQNGNNNYYVALV